MLNKPSIVCRVVKDIDDPIMAFPGQVLSAWPGHPHLSLSVLTGDCSRVIRSCYCPERVLYAELLNLFLDGAIRLPVRSQRALLEKSA